MNILLKEFQDVFIIRNKKNYGFSKGCNIGIYYALKKQFDYVLLLNTDTIVDPYFLNDLIRVGEKYERIGMLTGKTYNYFKQNVLCSAGANINWILGTNAFHRGEDEYDTGKYDTARNVNFIPGYYMLIKRKVLEKCGPLNDIFFLGGEELEFSVRVKRNGFILAYVPTGKIWHKVTASHRKYDPRYIYNGYRNRMIFVRLLYPRFIWLMWYTFYFTYAKTYAPFRLKEIAKNWGEKIDIDKTKIAINEAIKDGARRKVRLEDLLKIDKIVGK